MIKLSDYVMNFLADLGIEHVFMVAGGGAMHLNDSLAHHPRIRPVCVLHEQAAAIAAESYGRVKGLPGAALVTSGPGGTNAITGVAGAWQDSIPCIFLSGQVKRSDLVGASGVRQMGPQEIDIVTLVRSITKYAVTVEKPEDIRFHLEKAWHLAQSGRPGPVWIDLPMDVQGALLDLDLLEGFKPDPVNKGPAVAPGLLDELLGRLSRAERPVLLLGHGIRSAKAEASCLELVNRLRIPVLTTWPAMDLLPDTYDLLVGRPGITAPRAANFAIQNADWLLTVGTRLDRIITGFAPESFARGAWKAMVDVDPTETAKLSDLIQLPIHADAGRFMGQLLAHPRCTSWEDRGGWIGRCQDWKRRYPLEIPISSEPGISVYRLADCLSDLLPEEELIVPCSSGLAVEIFLLAFRTKKGQRLFNTTGLGAMGYGIAAATGAAVARPGTRVVGLDGDGGFFMNIQELETLRRLALPVKLFVVNNGGYASIRASQARYFHRLSGADAGSGLTLPDIRKVSEAFGIRTWRLDSEVDLTAQLKDFLESPGPGICEIISPSDEPRIPSVASIQRPDGSMVSRPMEDLLPFLDRAEFFEQMTVPPLPASLEVP